MSQCKCANWEMLESSPRQVELETTEGEVHRQMGPGLGGLEGQTEFHTVSVQALRSHCIILSG